MTRGPWYVRDMRASYMASLGWTGPSIDSILIVDKTANQIVESAGENCVVARIGFENRNEALADSHLADARLIAAAPDLLEAIRPLAPADDATAEHFSSMDPDDTVTITVPVRCILRARAAIAKAEQSA